MAAPLLDRYAWAARVAPAVLVVLPVALAASALPTISKTLSSLALSAAGAAALTVLAAQFAGDAGRERERQLFRRWGGAPTTRMLRHRQSSLPAETLNRYHRKLSDLTGLAMPTAAAEVADPNAADGVYASAVAAVRERTRDRERFPAVASALADYGFRRNLWGMRVAGLCTSIGGTVACGGIAWSLRGSDGGDAAIVGVLGNAALTAVWAWAIDPRWVRQAAQGYASRLLGTLDVLP